MPNRAHHNITQRLVLTKKTVAQKVPVFDAQLTVVENQASLIGAWLGKA
jgi:hypothetical protein